MNVLKVLLDVDRRAQTLLEVTPAPVDVAIVWQMTAMDVMVSFNHVREEAFKAMCNDSHRR